ncbi:BA14K family protein [Methylobacterium sp. E-005]|uniref:BA14K family protein n=1 Tax=Methylobacterium sp. E-005 TaxID=2836549 RepID=UPI001FBA8F4F|nr:BA14K family protein [Methylobacterium sp. E-005]MCJ2088264.1 BA14K family protein [Methylobacterium sp. E-005]
MVRIDRARRHRVCTALILLSLTMAGAEAHGFGGFHGGAVGPRVGAWGRPLGPVRPGIAPGGFVRPGFVGRPPYTDHHHHWHRGYWGYGSGLGGFGLGLGLGGLLGTYGDPWYDDGYVDTPPVDMAPVEVPVEVEAETNDPVAIAVCARRFRTYDPRTQTYIGRGYVRRPCPWRPRAARRSRSPRSPDRRHA